jgi:hypothetical protein
VPDDRVLDEECIAFTRYLTGQVPAAYAREKYRDAHARNALLHATATVDRLLLSVARAHGLGAWLADAYTAVFLKRAVVRKKWVLLVAILESSAPASDFFDTPDSGGRALLLARLAWKGVAFVVGLGLSTVLFLPSQLLMGAPPRRPGHP